MLLEIYYIKADNMDMDTGQIIFISSQLILGAIAAFLAIFLWPKTRDAAWMLVIFGSIVVYIETVYSLLKIFGISAEDLIVFGSVSLISFILPTIRTILFIAAFAIMIYRQSKN